MSLVVPGISQYSLGSMPVTGIGLLWSESELDNAIVDTVADLVFDTEGNQIITALLESIVDTDFDSKKIKEVLANSHKPEDWRVGEAIGEAYLVHHRKCKFPWPDSRDERKAGSSLPGADLVGFYIDGDDAYFAFGEIKTSAQEQYPPGVIHGRGGMHQQLEDLRDKKIIRDDLFKYLAHRAINASWQQLFVTASKKYLQSSTSVKIFGVLIRDVPPHENDLKNRIEKLRQSCPENMHIELLAIYLPTKSISSLSTKVLARKRGDSSQ